MKQTEQQTIVTPQSVVALTWTMKDSLGEVLDVLDEPVEFLVGGDDLLESVESALMGRCAGEAISLRLEPEQAFGDYDEQKVFLEARQIFPAELEEGMTFDGHALPAGTSGGLPRDMFYIVSEIYPEHVVLDGNHPLAGIALNLHLRIHHIRPATVDEAGRGSAGTGFFRVG